MAAAPDPDKLLCSTDGKANFQRLARLLISGGTSLLREIVDASCPPSNLPTVLSNPATKTQLKSAKLTKPQWDCLYPTPGMYGKSTDFDITLLFRLLRTICNITPPTMGWDVKPAIADYSLAADLVRIKSYRNSFYGHVIETMEITDDEFLSLWKDISGALVRIAGQVSQEKQTKWQQAIDEFLKDPLTGEDERNVQELERWYKNDMEVKKCMEELKATTEKGIDCFQEGFEGMSLVIKKKTQCLKTTVREETQGIKDQLKELKTKTQGVQGGIDCLETSLKNVQKVQGTLEEKTDYLATVAQDMTNKLKEVYQSIDRLTSSADGSPLTGGMLNTVSFSDQVVHAPFCCSSS